MNAPGRTYHREALNIEIYVARKTEVWFGCYFLIGLAQNGVAPILLPLASHGGTGSGLSYASFALTGLFAPIFGSWGDREGRHRDLLIWGSALAAVSFLPLCVLPNGLPFILLAALAGLGITAATTAGNVLAIAGLKEDLWNGRIGLLQRVVSAGQVVGLVLAGILALQHLEIAFILTFFALAGAAGLALAYAPVSSARAAHAKPLAQPVVGGEAGAPGLQQNSHHSSFTQLAAFANVISRPLAQFLLVWVISYTAMNGIAVLFPVVMTQHYGMSPIWPALTYAIGVCASLLIYGPVSRWTTQHGAGRTLFAGLVLRLILFLALAIFSLFRAPYIGIAVLITFALIQFVWPLLAVSTIAISVSLARQAPGESIGLYNATSSIASSAGAAIGGLIFGLYGLSFLSGAAMLAVALSVFLAWLWFSKSAATAL